MFLRFFIIRVWGQDGAIWACSVLLSPSSCIHLLGDVGTFGLVWSRTRLYNISDRYWKITVNNVSVVYSIKR